MQLFPQTLSQNVLRFLNFDKTFDYVFAPQLKAFTSKFLIPLILASALILTLLSLLIINSISYTTIVLLHMFLFTLFSTNSPIPVDVITNIYLLTLVLMSVVKGGGKAFQFVSSRSGGWIN
jgi:hypothetical protein